MLNFTNSHSEIFVHFILRVWDTLKISHQRSICCSSKTWSSSLSFFTFFFLSKDLTFEFSHHCSMTFQLFWILNPVFYCSSKIFWYPSWKTAINAEKGAPFLVFSTQFCVSPLIFQYFLQHFSGGFLGKPLLMLRRKFLFLVLSSQFCVSLWTFTTSCKVFLMGFLENRH